jgi:formate dehydrogenase alpha subunit
MEKAMSILLTINDQVMAAEPGDSVLDIARAHGVVIPTLCHQAALSPAGSCRLCLVEVEGVAGPLPACTLKAAAGMAIHTETPALAEMRRTILEMLLADYHDAPAENGQVPDTEFMHWVRHYNARPPVAGTAQPRYAVGSDPNPFIHVDLNKCILCTRCVRACAEIQGRSVWGVSRRGAETVLAAGAGTTMLEARCESCGLCAEVCPTGALADAMSFGAGQPDRLVTTTCTYCGVGCQFDLNVKDECVVRVTSNPLAPVNGIHLCVKGRYGYDFIHHADRLTRPRVRRYLLEGRPRGADGRGEWVETDWDTALDIVARKLMGVKRESGPNAVGVLASAKCTNEENYLMQKFARQVVGTNNVDHCARLCHASTVAGLAMCYGSGAMSNTMDDVAEQARAIFVIGSNTTEQHPVFGSRLRQAVRQRGAKLVVADPRRIDLTEFATLHLRHKPGTDVALINGLMHIILANGWEDRAFIENRCENFEAFAASLQAYPPQRVAEITGVPAADLREAARLLAQNKPMAVIWAMGITQHTTGVINVLSLGNLQMLLGNLGVPGGGVNPLRGQNNVQGACDMGALPNVMPGYQAVVDAAVRDRFNTSWRTEYVKNHQTSPYFALPNKPGLTVTEMIPRAGTGQVRALYILGEDPVLTDPDSNHVRQCLDACEFVVLQEIFPSETAVFADVLLPGASFAEKDGTFTNTERRIQLVRQAIAPLGDARPDWWITAELARRLLALEDRLPIGTNAGWTYASPAQIMDEIAAVTPSYAGVSHARLEGGAQLHWPVKALDHPGTPILHVGQFTRGLGRFHVVEHLPPQELPDAEYPMLLTTGRVIYHWHGGEMTRRAQGLLAVYPESLVEINPDDAARLGLNGHRTVRLKSRRGEMVAEAVITDRVSPGLIFGNFHFSGQQNVNNLTIAALDPVAKIPEYKVCAVRLELA